MLLLYVVREQLQEYWFFFDTMNYVKVPSNIIRGKVILNLDSLILIYKACYHILQSHSYCCHVYFEVYFCLTKPAYRFRVWTERRDVVTGGVIIMGTFLKWNRSDSIRSPWTLRNNISFVWGVVSSHKLFSHRSLEELNYAHRFGFICHVLYIHLQDFCLFSNTVE